MEGKAGGLQRRSTARLARALVEVVLRWSGAVAARSGRWRSEAEAMVMSGSLVNDRNGRGDDDGSLVGCCSGEQRSSSGTIL